jgi:hypothetical protein
MLSAVRINGAWLQVIGEGLVKDIRGNPVARSFDVVPGPWHSPVAFLTSPKETIVSTAMLETASGPPLVVVKEQFLQAAVRIANKPVLLVKDTWATVVDKLHLTSAMSNYVRPAGAWTMGMARLVGGAVGWTGGIGIGLLAVSTGFGRKVIKNTVGLALKGVGKVIGKVYSMGHSVMSHLWAPGRWINKMADKAVGFGARTLVKGLTFSDDHIAKHVDVNSNGMHAVKHAGTIAVGIKAAMLIPIPFLSGVVWTGTGLYALGVVLMAGASLDHWFEKTIGPISKTDSVVRPTLKAVKDEAVLAETVAEAAPETANRTYKPRRTSAQVKKDNEAAAKKKAAAEQIKQDAAAKKLIDGAEATQTVVLTPSITEAAAKAAEAELVKQGAPVGTKVAFKSAVQEPVAPLNGEVVVEPVKIDGLTLQERIHQIESDSNLRNRDARRPVEIAAGREYGATKKVLAATIKAVRQEIAGRVLATV